MAAWERLINSILTTRWNWPMPVLIVPAGVAYWIGLKQQSKQTQIIEKIEALTEKVDSLTSRVD
ncbi:hypothetical protein LTR56_009905 [Elasticomyces elasticus]|nr:hypothetical protein LTR56_009905 [Elasticomyces elasticus]KAK3659221.1 hypothetical protein LTR22_008684 [Elasticomyces elasticus]KAK4923103.1 hypothetical protein LTR49_009571 [Elasticomyces elasticus]KAK5761487.1 hypothetical protein LTS12_008279 [Elasticomyces elasticus]